ncbi:MAG: NAAT family transporter [Elusimicrobiaceae bacterium]|nr:NAAT family transporter [Elusimicrobiaceae bacterium]
MELISSYIITLILVMDPFGNIPLFITALKRVPTERRTKVLIRELMIALFIMMLFLFAGAKMLAWLGIAKHSLGISGGIVLFIMSIKLVFNSSLDEQAQINQKDEEPFLVPLAIPLIAGPASLSMLLILSAGAPSKIWYLFIAVLFASILNGLILLLSFPISNLLGKRGIIALERLTGLLMVLISVNMMMGGISEFVKSLS